MKSLLTAFDLTACLFTALSLHEMRRPPALAIVYAWNPLVLKVLSGSGHVDGLIGALLAACVYFLLCERRGAAALAFSAAVLAKMTPLLLFPFLARRVGVRYSVAAAAVVLGGYLPFRDADWHLFDGLFAFGNHWQFNAGPFAAFRFVTALFTSTPESAARALSALAIAALVGWAMWRDDGRNRSFAGVSATVLGFSILLGPVVMPWYLAGVLPVAAVSGKRIWVWYSALILFAFWVMVDGTERNWALFLEYGLFGLALYASMRHCAFISSKEPQ